MHKSHIFSGYIIDFKTVQALYEIENRLEFDFLVLDRDQCYVGVILEESEKCALQIDFDNLREWSIHQKVRNVKQMLMEIDTEKYCHVTPKLYLLQF